MSKSFFTSFCIQSTGFQHLALQCGRAMGARGMARLTVSEAGLAHQLLADRRLCECEKALCEMIVKETAL